jgi:iron complex outermembrane receptor protein
MSLLGVAGAAAQQQTPADTSPQSSQPPRILHKETVTVTAPGEVRTEQSISEATIQEAAPGTSPIRIVSQLPSVDYTSADPYGAYEWAVRISVRGFNQNQLGFTLDEVPLGDMSYGNWNGLHISRAIIDENLGRAVLSQGTGALETASNSNLGGTVQFYSLDPSDTRSFTVEQSFGSFNAYRTVGRFESGLLGGKTKFYVTGVSQFTDKWKGSGDIGQNYWQLNTKIVHYFGSKGVLTGYFDYSDRHETDYQDLSKVYEQKLGYKWDNYGNWPQSVQAAYATAATYAASAALNGPSNAGCDVSLSGTPYSFPGAVANLDPVNDDPCDAAYYAGAGLRKDYLGYLNYKAALTSKLTWKTTAYGHGDDGIGLWFAPSVELTPSNDPNFFSEVLAATGSPIVMRSSEYGIQRGGFLTSLSYESARNRLEGGMWYEHENFDLARRVYATGATAPNQSLDSFPKNPFSTLWGYNFGIDVIQIHLQDQYKVSNALTVSAGFKTLYNYIDGKLSAPSTDPSNFAQGQLNAGKPFQPQLGLNYKLDKHNELFTDAAYNVRTYQAGGNGFGNAPWGTTQAGFDALKSTLRPETSWTEEGGYRYTGPKGSLQASYFHVNFNDRLLATKQGAGIAGNASLLSNVGGVTTNGMDVAATLPLPSGFALYNGFTYSRSTYDDDLVTKYDANHNPLPANTYATKGKLAVDAPEYLYKTELSYNHKELFSHIDADYMSKRYYAYDNTGSVDGRFLTNVAGGYNRKELGPLQDLKLQLSIYNLTGEKYYSSIGTNGFDATDPTGESATLQVGSPRTFVGSLSVRF